MGKASGQGDVGKRSHLRGTKSSNVVQAKAVLDKAKKVVKGKGSNKKGGKAVAVEVKDPCGRCNQRVKFSDAYSLQCILCRIWYHLHCHKLSVHQVITMAVAEDLQYRRRKAWMCQTCKTAKPKIIIDDLKTPEMREDAARADKVEAAKKTKADVKAKKANDAKKAKNAKVAKKVKDAKKAKYANKANDAKKAKDAKMAKAAKKAAEAEGMDKAKTVKQPVKKGFKKEKSREGKARKSSAWRMANGSSRGVSKRTKNRCK
jgi:hypothetical protein